MNKKILVVSQYFYPEQFRINDICKTWVSRGYDVTVLTGIPNYPSGDFFKGFSLKERRKEEYEGVNVIRIPIIPRKKSSIMMALNYISFVISGFFWMTKNKKKFDLVFTYEVSPMTQALSGVRIAKKMNIPHYIYVLDLWPENFEIITGIKNKLVIGILDKMVNYIYRNSKLIFTASKSFKKNIQNRGFVQEKIIFWPQYAEEFYKPVINKLDENPQLGIKNIVFAGNVGFAQGLNILSEVLKKIADEKLKVKFHIVGDGRFKNQLMSEIKEKGLENYIVFYDSIPAEDIPDLFASFDFSFISLNKNNIFSMTIPAKLQSSMACGIPILLSADGEVSEIIRSSKSGFCSGAGDVEGLFQNIRLISQLSTKEITEYGKNSREYYEKNFEKKMLMDMMDNYFMEG
ncbi:glycosyltransferase family 4 protein [Enterococcus sp. HY326]|uniref:glycosyltransferase family 4 protein n=1 Tax=Enterococcus sp. HY326 TaxID=2971265 RepID=UPI00223F4B26|nr:glycosyltransferase family 4 protein [Enterococcus sp. HY326]